MRREQSSLCVEFSPLERRVSQGRFMPGKLPQSGAFQLAFFLFLSFFLFSLFKAAPWHMEVPRLEV